MFEITSLKKQTYKKVTATLGCETLTKSVALGTYDIAKAFHFLGDVYGSTGGSREIRQRTWDLGNRGLWLWG